VITNDDFLTIHQLHEKGVERKQIARLLHLDPKTVRKALSQNAYEPRHRKDKVIIDEDLLRDLYGECKGYVQRVHEKLTEEHGLTVSYSTVLRTIHEYNIGNNPKEPCARVPDIPGAEMQHDTSPHDILVGNKKYRLTCSGLYFRYSKMRYIRYYKRFTRFTMKCFLDEALRHFGYSAQTCIIDNTSLAIDYGSGRDAVFSREMVKFAHNYGFRWYAHAIGHANRKAGKERNFYTVETNFLPGRIFSSQTDLNQQAFDWAVNRYAHRPQSKTRLIPSQLFESEKASLRIVPEYIHPPVQNHHRTLDQYGYIAFNGNFYWVPKTQITSLPIIEYPDHIVIYDTKHTKLITHPLYDELTKGEICTPAHVKKVHRYTPRNIKHSSKEEEARLRNDGESVCRFLDFIKSKESKTPHRHRFIKNLYRLRKKTTNAVFVTAIERALEYKVNDMGQITNIFSQILRKPLYEKSIVQDYTQREEYIAGKFTAENPFPGGE
jgi:transposase